MVLEYGLQLLFLDIQLDWLRCKQLIALVPQMVDIDSVPGECYIRLPIIWVLFKHLLHLI